MSCGAMKKSGADLRKAIMTAKGMTSSEGLRGIEYQLLNALAVRNVNKFMDVVMRLYSAYGSKRNEDGHELLIPTGFVQMLNDKQKFTEYGYAFVMGLVGSYEPKKEGSMIMKREGLTFTVIFLAESANYGEGIGNISSLKK